MRLGQWGRVIMLLASSTSTVWAAIQRESEGIALESTRIIYSESAKKGITFTVINRTPNIYLLQSRVQQWASNVPTATILSDKYVAMTPQGDVVSMDNTRSAVAVPFIVIPPLTRFSPDESMTLRIRLTKNNLPIDKESLFSLSLKVIPSQSKPLAEEEGDDAKMVLALQNNLKLFYRPAGLAVMSAKERSAALQFTLQGSLLTINNPTPYYVTLGQVKVGKMELELGQRRMLAPFARGLYSVTDHSTSTTKVSWRLIDDEGQNTPLLSQPLH